MKKILTIQLMALGILLGVSASTAMAHPGNTASDGCHFCRTNCDSWGVPWNTRHCHGGYTTPPPRIPIITHTTDTTKEVIPFEKITENDPNLEIGKTAIKQIGINGERTITYSVRKIDGIEASRSVKNNKITINPINEITLIGTKTPEPVTLEGAKGPNQYNQTKVASASDGVVGVAGIVLLGVGAIWYYLRKRKE